MTNNHAELFNGLLEAGRALEELPLVKAELDRIKGDLTVAEGMIDEQASTLSAKVDEIARLTRELAAREAELASATFRAEQSQKALDTIRGYLDFNSDRMGAVDASVGQPQAVVSQSESEPTPAAEGGSKPITEESALLSHDFTKHEGETIGTVMEPSAPLPSADSQGTTYGGETAADRHGYDVATPPAPEVAANPLPYSGRPHWQKPSIVTWYDWINGGGDKPYWWTDADDVRPSDAF